MSLFSQTGRGNEFLKVCNKLGVKLRFIPENQSYIHVGGDECAVRWWKESEETQSFMRAHRLKNEKELHRYFIHYVQGVVNAKGKTLVGWDEILEGGVSADCVVMNWRKSAQAVKALKNGHQVIVTPSAYTYLNIKESRRQKELGFPGFLPLEKVYDLPILPDSLSVHTGGLHPFFRLGRNRLFNTFFVK